jgi:hypothetical protein
MTPQSIINIARSIYNDNESNFYRISNLELLGFVNDGLKECSRIISDYFKSTGNYTCTENQTEQVLNFEDAQLILDVIRIKDGKSVLPMDMMAMSAFNPDWASDNAAPAQNWTRHANDPLRFYIYPKAPDMQLLEVMYIRNPLVYALDDTISEVPESFAPAFADYVIYRAESRDDEHSNSSRAVSHYQAFVQKLGGKVSAPQGTQGA